VRAGGSGKWSGKTRGQVAVTGKKKKGTGWHLSSKSKDRGILSKR